MTYQYRREPLTAEEEDKLVNACKTHQEKLVVWTLLDTGLRVSELANLVPIGSYGRKKESWSMEKEVLMEKRRRGESSR